MSVEAIVPLITAKSQSKLEMVRAIWFWLCHNIGFGRGLGAHGGQWCQQQKTGHMWNAVELEGQWCLLDACWGAGTVDPERRLFVPR
ncbi:Kyphoscoliosis peptidase-like protein [Aix galericulata]|nr:Kyphoscoliosis peptidase-like protein [Aix galericulata]